MGPHNSGSPGAFARCGVSVSILACQNRYKCGSQSERARAVSSTSYFGKQGTAEEDTKLGGRNVGTESRGCWPDCSSDGSLGWQAREALQQDL